MLRHEIEAELARDPFVPLRFCLKDGKKINVSSRDAAHLMGPHFLVIVQGLKPGGHLAKSLTTVAFENVIRIEPAKGKGGMRRRKAS